MSAEPKIDLKRLLRLHRLAECPTLVTGPKFETTTSAIVQHALTEPDGCPILEFCLPHHAAYAVEAWNQAPLLAAEVERLKALLGEAIKLARSNTRNAIYAKEILRAADFTRLDAIARDGGVA